MVLGPGTDEDRYAGIEGAVGAVAGAARYDGAVMDRAPGLRVIARTGIGYDAVDVAAATARGIAVCNTPDGPTISTAEHAITLMLMVAKKVKPSEAALISWDHRAATTPATRGSSWTARSSGWWGSAGSPGGSRRSPRASGCASSCSIRTSMRPLCRSGSAGPIPSTSCCARPTSCRSTSR